MIRTIAIDDEPLALKLITRYITKTPFLELVNASDNPLDVLEILKNESIDLIYTDIQMPDLSGTDFVRLLSEGPKVVFTTAFEHYAVEGFKLNAVDYLLKPFSYEEFLSSAQKVRKLIELEQKALTLLEANNEFLFLKSEYKIRRINFNDILYIEGLKDYIKVFIKNEEKPILSISTLKMVESKLPSQHFMRVHRSYIVNLDKIDTIERSRIVFGKVYIPVSDQYKDNFQVFLDRNFL